jgi:hypothetical protein
LALPAEPDDARVLVECECPANVEALNQGKAGAINDAERLIGPFLRDLPATAEILGSHTYDRDDASMETIPEPHGRPASEPGADQEPAFDNDVVTGRDPVGPDSCLQRGQSPPVVAIAAVGERVEPARINE